MIRIMIIARIVVGLLHHVIVDNGYSYNVKMLTKLIRYKYI